MVSELHTKFRKLKILQMEDIAKLLDYEALQEFRDSALNPEHPVTRGTAQNPDIYFQARKLPINFMMRFLIWLKIICRKLQK